MILCAGMGQEAGVGVGRNTCSPSNLTSGKCNFQGHCQFITIHQVVLTEQSDWSTRPLEHAHHAHH